jgi:hypothetical protein
LSTRRFSPHGGDKQGTGQQNGDRPCFPGFIHGHGWNSSSKRFDDKTLFNPSLAGAAGAVVSNISDLLVFSRALCRGGLLKPQTQRERMDAEEKHPTVKSCGARNNSFSKERRESFTVATSSSTSTRPA